MSWQGKYVQDVPLQNCQHGADTHEPPLHERQFVPLSQSQVLPGRNEQAPQVQLLVQTSCEHGSQLPARVAPGVQTPPPEHAPKAPHAPQPQVPLQVRVRERVPPAHASVSVSTMPAMHSPSPVHTGAPQAQPIPQVRIEVPQRPQTPPGSTVPAMHSPLPAQAPAFIHSPATHSCCCVPQNPQGTSRGGAPSTHSHAGGAVHALQTPLEHCSTPTPQTDEHVRSASLPMPAVLSSQSSAVGTPSPSASAVGLTHSPARHTSAPTHAGVQPEGPPSMFPPSMSMTRGMSRAPPMSY